ncbi:MAG: 4-hydroxy-tetrahydrodipicolinate synthase [Acidimicrobiales bacterium]
MAARFGSVITAMVTPFDAVGALDLDAAATLARWLEEQGNEGLVVAGTTGEAPVLSDDEKRDLWRAVVEAVSIPVIAGTGSNDTRHTIESTKTAKECGAAAALVVTPYYNKPTQAGLEAHFRAVAGATDLPLMLYDVPGRTAKRIDPSLLVRLAREVATIVAVKDAAGDPATTARVVAETPDGFEVYSGDEPLMLPMAAVGAVGVVGVASHWTAPEQRELFAALEKGDLAVARDINARLLPSFAFMNSETCVFSQATKALLTVLGLPVGECRLPLGPAPDGTADRARAVLRGLGRDV